VQNDRFEFQTVANTREMVPGKNAKKHTKPEAKKTKTILHPFVYVKFR
jgi:hypothetical protein